MIELLSGFRGKKMTTNIDDFSIGRCWSAMIKLVSEHKQCKEDSNGTGAAALESYSYCCALALLADTCTYRNHRFVVRHTIININTGS